MTKRFIALGMAAALSAAAVIPAFSMTVSAEGNPVYRLYNPTNGDHMYTSSKEEYDIAIQGIYEGEGQIYNVTGTGSPIYRVYNHITGEHLYTASAQEKDACVAKGWRDEGISFTTEGDTNVYRLFSPGALHVFTSDDNEIKVLTGMGWTNEGVAWKVYASGTDRPSTGMPNPVVECASMDEMNSKASTKIIRPGVMGITNESYSIINADPVIAQYRFELNGTPFVLRSSNTTKDISGYYVNGKTVFSDIGNDPINYYSDDKSKLACWLTIDGQFVLIADDNGAVSQESFANLCEELRSTITPTVEPEVPYDQLAGEYQDTFSKRAVMTVTDEGDHVKMLVSWGSSAMETEQWTMTARFYEDGLLSYKDCTKTKVTFKDDNTSTTVTEYTNGEGFFSYSDGKLMWTGAADDGCKECVFEKIN